MLKAIMSALLFSCVLSVQASAQSCPDFFRFVDFGLEGPDGVTYRGGPVLRAEGFSGSPLLLRELTTCVDVPQMASDGHGNPIPVVESIVYDPLKTGIALTNLRVAITQDAAASADASAVTHRARLDQSGARTTRSDRFLCVAPREGGAGLSCQVQSPFGGTAALVIYCDQMTCTMPVMAMNEQIFASATWAVAPAFFDDAQAAGADILATVEQIHAFLAPISSSL